MWALPPNILHIILLTNKPILALLFVQYGWITLPAIMSKPNNGLSRLQARHDNYEIEHLVGSQRPIFYSKQHQSSHSNSSNCKRVMNYILPNHAKAKSISQWALLYVGEAWQLPDRASRWPTRYFFNSKWHQSSYSSSSNCKRVMNCILPNHAKAKSISQWALLYAGEAWQLLHQASRWPTRYFFNSKWHQSSYSNSSNCKRVMNYILPNHAKAKSISQWALSYAGEAWQLPDQASRWLTRYFFNSKRHQSFHWNLSNCKRVMNYIVTNHAKAKSIRQRALSCAGS